MKFDNQQLLPPEHWQDFEKLCLALFRADWDYRLTKRNGRGGQPQNGVDIWGRPKSEGGNFWGVQCKGKNRFYGTQVTLPEVKRELRKANRFKPSLSHWIFATTASSDSKIDEAIRELSTSRERRGKFLVSVLWWEDIVSMLGQHLDVAEKWYGNAVDDPAKLARAIKKLIKQGGQAVDGKKVKPARRTHAIDLRARDIASLTKLFQNIHIPTLDQFIEEMPKIIKVEVFYFWESFNALMSSSSFHIYDDKIRVLLEKLHRVWDASTQFGRHYDLQIGGRQYIFHRRGNYEQILDAEADYQSMKVYRQEMHRILKALVKMVRERFPELDLTETNAYAWRDWLRDSAKG